jgi:hypothetical protein
MISPFTQFSQRFPPGTFRAAAIRLVLLLAFVGALYLAWWSVNRLAPIDKLLQIQSEKIARLEDDVLQMELKWNAAEAEQVAGKFKLAQEQVFAGHDDFNRWKDELKRQTNQFALDVKTQAGRTQACPLPNKVFAIIPATLELQAPTDETSTKPSYKRLLEFTQNLTTQKKRVDLVGMKVGGNSNSVSQATLELQLWAQENRQ